MAQVRVPAEMRQLTGGERVVPVEGRTLGEVIAALDARYPGFRARLLDGDRVRSGLNALVAGARVGRSLTTAVGEADEVTFLRQVGGG